MLAKIWNRTYWVELDGNWPGDGLIKLLQRSLEQSGFEILGHQSYQFKPQGKTCLWLLAESHLALHTWPEHGVAYLELSSCNEEKSLSFNDSIFCNLVVRKSHKVVTEE
ncbi:spermidine synthase [Candidatus Pacearchaeota archaeon]|nr:spermidine synthase [Candidatus Pacearchaeota archaeon]